MRVNIKPIQDTAEEQVIIECVEVTKDIEDIRAYVLTKGTEASAPSRQKTK